ncbi:Thermostable beta-glucosidase B [uncultured Flavonifractor sp.]|nr:Thermostable beta-glucosidase B [uncultured Flavonifractor sp.]
MTADEILKQLSLEEKIALGSGANFWQTKGLPQYGVPSLFMCDGPHGLRKQEITAGGTDMLGINESVPSTCFPSASLSACSWDPELLSLEAAAIAEEAAALHVGLVLGPGACMKRNPLCGRNFEYLSEDPFLAGKLAAGFIRGAEGSGIGTSLKHFAANNQEYRRFLSSSQMDERTLRELYLPAFEIAVKEGKPSSVMCAYNQVDDIFCASNKRLLTDILRTEWGFGGVVVTDWGALHNRTESFRAGCDLAMPGGSGYGEAEALQAVKDGTLPEAQVDACARRVLELLLKEAWVQQDTPPVDLEAHHALAARVAAESIVLLKNEAHILPFAAGTRVALIGAMAETPRYQGAGSSHINPTRLTSLRDALPDAPYVKGCEKDGSADDALIAEAAEAAKTAEAVVLCVGLPDTYESEGFDRENMKMPDGHNRLVEAVAKANKNTVVVLMCGSAVETPWADQVKGILFAGLSGQAGGTAIADALYGRVNPSGRLAESWPMRYEDCPSSACYGEGFTDAEYREGIFVGYRYYDSANVPVRFPFGYGLSYTSFACSDLHVTGDTVTVRVANTGKCAGSEVVQMYIRPPKGALSRPVRELKGFAKVFLAPGEEKTVSMPLNDRSFAVWNNGWSVQKGTYTIEVHGLTADIHRNGVDIPAPPWQANSWYETLSGKPSQAQLEAMLGHSLRKRTLKKRQFTMDNTISEMKDYSLIMKIMYASTVSVIKKGLPDGASEDSPELRMMIASSCDTPLSSVISTAGMPPCIFEGLLDMANGHYFRGIKRMITGRRRRS